MMATKERNFLQLPRALSLEEIPPLQVQASCASRLPAGATLTVKALPAR